MIERQFMDQPTELSEQSQPVRLVVIDDHEVVRKGLVSVIDSQKDMTVLAHCGDAETGAQHVDEFKPDIVLTDISMPGSSPFDMVRKLKGKHPDTKVIFLTAYSTDSNLERALRAGSSGFVTKTDSIDEILEAIKEVERGNSYFSDNVKGRIVANQNGSSSDQEDGEEITVRRELLSPREVEVLCCVGRGQTAKQIAGHLNISSKTVERHKSNIMAKLGIHSQVDLARYAIREGLITALD